jgi:hypothetical protein
LDSRLARFRAGAEHQTSQAVPAVKGEVPGFAVGEVEGAEQQTGQAVPVVKGEVLGLAVGEI